MATYIQPTIEAQYNDPQGGVRKVERTPVALRIRWDKPDSVSQADHQANAQRGLAAIGAARELVQAVMEDQFASGTIKGPGVVNLRYDFLEGTAA